MRSIHQLMAGITLALISGLINADTHQATDAEASTSPEQVSSVDAVKTASPQRTPDIRTIIDMSGSMKKTDPNNLRAPAMRLLVDLLPKDSKSGVWTFGQYVNMLVKHRVIDDAWKEEAKTKSNDISSVGLFTNIGDSLETAGYDLDRLKPEYEPFFILLTDGMVDINKDPDVNKKEQERILKEVVPKFAEAGVKLHTIALSDKADQEFLQQLSLSTGGMSTVAENSDDLLKAFVRLFDQSVPSEEVPLKDNKFLIDSSIEEFTALIFRKEGSSATQLVSPDESVIDADSNDPDVTWHTDEKYDLITIKRPYEGEWILQAEADPDNRVTVVSDLTLQFEEIPSTIFSGEEINIHAWFDSADGQVKEPEFLSLLDGSLQLMNEAGKSIQKEISVQTEGEYQHAFYEKIRNLRRPGEFEISIVVDGKTFKRQRSHRVEVLEPFAYQVDYDGIGPDSVGLVSAVPLLSGLDLEKTQVIAAVKGPDDSSLIASAELQFTQDGQKWVVQVIPTKGEGVYRVSLDLKLVLETGKEFRLKPKPFDLTLPYFPEGYIQPEPEPELEAQPDITPVIEEPQLSEPEKPTMVAEEMPEVVEEEKPEEDSTFMLIMLGVLALVAAILGFLFYKLRAHKKVQEEIHSEEATSDADEDIEGLSQLDMGELDESVDESPELSEQVDAVREELERMGGASEDSPNEGISDDQPPELDQDELVSALDELSGNDTELDADDMVDDSSSDSDQDDAFDPVAEETGIEESIDEQLDALLEETESDETDAELDSMIEEAEAESIPTLDEELSEESEPELEIDFDSEVVEDAVEAPDESEVEVPVVTDSIEEVESASDDSLDDFMDEVMDEAEASKLEEDEFVEDADGEMLGNEGDEEIDDFGDSIDQALDELLAESDEATEVTEEFDIDDLGDLDSELDELTKDLEQEAFGEDSSSVDALEESTDSSSQDNLDELDALLEGDPDELDLDALATETDSDTDEADDMLEAALGELDASPMDDELTALEDISADELETPDDGEVDIDRIMAEIDAEAIRQNQENKDSE